MEDLIELYLLKNKKCPLPALGVLQVINTNAVVLFREGKIEAPVPVIKLLEPPEPADDFIQFIASQKNISVEEASILLTQYCNKLMHMDAYGETKLPHSGKFYVNSDGNLVFKTMEMPRAFSPDLNFERVIHPAVSHTMVVGDKETTNTEMAAYYSDTETTVKDKWWIWALAFALVSAAGLFLHFNEQKNAAATGNTRQIDIQPTAKTYRIAE